MTDVFLAAGVRTPFVKAGGVYAQRSALELSIPVVQRMRAQARPDLLVWGQVIPDPAVSNIARELVFEASLEPTIPAYSTVLACSTSSNRSTQLMPIRLYTRGARVQCPGVRYTAATPQRCLTPPVAVRCFHA